MNSTIRALLILALPLQLFWGAAAAYAGPNRLQEFCQKAENAIQGRGIPQAEFAQGVRTIKSQCNLGLMLLSEQTGDPAKICNDITYEVKNRWSVSRRVKTALLGLLETDCRSSFE